MIAWLLASRLILAPAVAADVGTAGVSTDGPGGTTTGGAGATAAAAATTTPSPRSPPLCVFFFLPHESWPGRCAFFFFLLLSLNVKSTSAWPNFVSALNENSWLYRSAISRAFSLSSSL